MRDTTPKEVVSLATFYDFGGSCLGEYQDPQNLL
jgi:hypothetical protein